MAFDSVVSAELENLTPIFEQWLTGIFWCGRDKNQNYKLMVVLERVPENMMPLDSQGM